MRHLKTGIPILGSIALLFGLAGCADENPWGNSSDKKGSISLSLSTDSGIKTAKPVFRSGEENSARDPNDLNTYIKVPSPEEFSIKLEKSDESFSKTWTSLKGFLNYTKENFFSTGAYTLTAFYGEKGKQDFNAPYFEASTTFNVLSDQVYEVDLTAGLQNSMVKVNYTDAFKEYMSDFHSSLRTEGRANEIIFSKDETDPAFVEPNDATLTVHITTKDKNYSTDLKIGDFPPLAKTLHNITLDIVKNENENENGIIDQLKVIFDDTLEEKIIKIDLTEELFTTEAPRISCTGFTDGQTIEVLEKSSYPDVIRMEAFVPGILSSAVLTLESDYRPSWGAEIDLCTASPDQIAATKEAFGEEAVKNFFLDEKDLAQNDYCVAVLDLTEFSKSLPAGKHKISLNVTDKLGRTSNTASLSIDSKPLELEVIETPKIGYCEKNTSITIAYNGNDPQNELKFKTTSDQANLVDIEIQSCEEIAASRSIDKKQYVLELQLPENVTAAREKIGVDIYHKDVKKTTKDIIVTVPEYDLEYDEFSDHAFVKVNLKNSNDPTLLRNVVRNLFLYINGTQKVSGVMNFDDEGYLAVADLQPDTEYAISSTITKGDVINNHESMNTEKADSVPNGDFEKLVETIYTTIDQGGKWTNEKKTFFTPNPTQFQTTLTMQIKEPVGWVSSNSLTCNINANNKNSWYVIPSVYNTTLSWSSRQPEAKVLGIGQSVTDITPAIYKDLKSQSETNAMVIRNVAWDLNGPSIEVNEQTGNMDYSNYFCSNQPSSIANRTAGYLYLTSKDQEGKDQEGVEFSSRPSILKGFYMYANDSQDLDEKGIVKVEILNGDKIIGSGQIELGSTHHYTEFVIPIEYISSMFAPKATKLKIFISSSNKPSEIKTTNYCNKEECCSRGATLTVDNLTFEY